jgi:hypothetical protein
MAGLVPAIRVWFAEARQKGVDAARDKRGIKSAGLIRSHRNLPQTDAETNIWSSPTGLAQQTRSFLASSQLTEKAELLRAGCCRYRSTPSRISKEYLVACMLIYEAMPMNGGDFAFTKPESHHPGMRQMPTAGQSAAI